jgi:lipopolysaccharide/colanic/teichoic acid biosynthesis glycosyltransferase
VAKALLARVRSSDAAGWLDPARIGALLADAGAEDAQRIAVQIGEQVSREVSRPDCRVYAYPRLGAEGPGDFIRDRGRVEGSPAAGERISLASEEGVYELLSPAVPAGKRAADVLLSAMALLLLLPLGLVLAAYIKLVSKGPVFYRQPRVGRACRLFSCLKFRTMHVSADATVHAQHMAELIARDTPMTKLEARVDRRLIPGARLLRASGLDELPQLLNVLRGDMSLVGPRPCVPYEFERYAQWHRRRCDTLPGITGLWQVSGKNRTTFTEMMRYDVQYARHPSPMQDARILLRTVPAVISEVCQAASRRRVA